LLRGQYLNPTVHDDDDGERRFSWGTRPSLSRRFPKVPSDEGRKLMESGVFGSYDRRMPNRKGLASRLLDRELGLNGRSGQKINQGLMAQVRAKASSSAQVYKLISCTVDDTVN
jgi:WD repeat-containing protein 23